MSWVRSRSVATDIVRANTKAMSVAVMMTGREERDDDVRTRPELAAPVHFGSVDDLLGYVHEKLPDEEYRVRRAENVGEEYGPIRAEQVHFATMV